MMKLTETVFRQVMAVALLALLSALLVGCTQTSVPGTPAPTGTSGTPGASGALPPSIDVDLGQSLAIKMALIPAGKFAMGSRRGRDDEQPVHEVTISQPFYMGVTEVTCDQVTAVLGKPSAAKFAGLEKPIDSVSWVDAVTFCNALSVQQKLEPCYAISGASVTCNLKASGFRLPTEAEWEYACRAGATTTYPWGDAYDGAFAWCLTTTVGPFGKNPYAEPNPAQTDPSQTPTPVPALPVLSASDSLSLATFPQTWESPGAVEMQSNRVGLKRPNAWGLHDMIGNMMEWCNDWYAPYTSGPKTDPTGPASGTYRILRGGGWMTLPPFSTPSSREWIRPDIAFDGYGFRVVRRARAQ